MSDTQLESMLQHVDHLIDREVGAVSFADAEFEEEFADPRVAEVCAAANVWVERLATARGMSAKNNVEAARQWLARVSSRSQALVGVLDPRSLDLLSGCLQRVESALARASKRQRTRSAPRELQAIRGRIGRRLRVPGY